MADVRYAKSGPVHIAYAVVGDGPFDVVFLPGFVSNVELQVEHPVWSGTAQRMGAFSRFIVWDKRGTGLSDPVAGVPSLDDRVDDLEAVLTAAASSRPALFGVSEGGPLALLCAA